MRCGDRHLEAVIHGLMVALDVGAIEPPDKGIQTERAEFAVALRRKLPGLVRHAPLAIDEIEVLLDGMAELPLEEHGPLAPTDDAHANVAAGFGEAMFRDRKSAS